MPSKLRIPVFLYREKFGERPGEDLREHLQIERGPITPLQDVGDGHECQSEEEEQADQSVGEQRARQSPNEDDEAAREGKQRHDESSPRNNSFSPWRDDADTQRRENPPSMATETTESGSPEQVQLLTTELLPEPESSDLDSNQRDRNGNCTSSLEIERHCEILHENSVEQGANHVEAVEIGSPNGCQSDSTNQAHDTETINTFPLTQSQNEEQSSGREYHVVPSHPNDGHKQLSSTTTNSHVEQESQKQILHEPQQQFHGQDLEPGGDQRDDILDDHHARHGQNCPPRENSSHRGQRSEQQCCEQQSFEEKNEGQSSQQQRDGQSVVERIVLRGTDQQNNEQCQQKGRATDAEVCPTIADSVGERGPSVLMQQYQEGSKRLESREVSNSEKQSPASRNQKYFEQECHEHQHLFQNPQQGENAQNGSPFNNIQHQPQSVEDTLENNYVKSLMSIEPMQVDTTNNSAHSDSQPQQSDTHAHSHPHPNPHHSEHHYVHHQQHLYPQLQYGQPYNHNPPPHDQNTYLQHHLTSEGNHCQVDPEFYPLPQPHQYHPQHHHENHDHPPPQTRPSPPSYPIHQTSYYGPNCNHLHHHPSNVPPYSQPHLSFQQQTQQQTHIDTDNAAAHLVPQHQAQCSYPSVDNDNPPRNNRDDQSPPPHHNKPPENHGATLIDLTAENDHPTGVDNALQTQQPAQPVQPVQLEWSKLEDSIIVNTINTFLNQRARESTTAPASASPPLFTHWGALAKKLPHRTESQICHRWINHLNPAISTAPFTHEEDILLYKRYSALLLQQPRRDFRNQCEKYLWQMDLFNHVSVNSFRNKRSGLQLRRRWYDAEFRDMIKKLYYGLGVAAATAGGRNVAGMANSEPDSSSNQGGPGNNAGEGVTRGDNRPLDTAEQIANAITEASCLSGSTGVTGGSKKRPRSIDGDAISADKNSTINGNKLPRGIHVTDSEGQLSDCRRTITNTDQLDFNKSTTESRDLLNLEGRRAASNSRTGTNSSASLSNYTARGSLEKMLENVNSHINKKLKKTRKKLSLPDCSKEDNLLSSEQAFENARSGMVVECWSEYQIDRTKSLPKLEGIRHRLITLLDRVESRINEELVIKALRENEFGIAEYSMDYQNPDNTRASEERNFGEEGRIDCCPLCLSTEDKDPKNSSEGLEGSCELCDARNFCRHCRSKCQICSRNCCVDCLMGCSECGSGAFCCDCAGYGLTARCESNAIDRQEDAKSSVTPGGGFCETCIVKELRSSAYGQTLGKRGCQKSVKKVQSVIRRKARDKGGKKVPKLRTKETAKKHQTLRPEVRIRIDGGDDTTNDTAENSPAGIATTSINYATVSNDDSNTPQSVTNETSRVDNRSLLAYPPPVVPRPVPLPHVAPLRHDQYHQSEGLFAEFNGKATRIEADQKMTRHKFIIDSKGPLGMTIDEGKRDKRITFVTDVKRCSTASGYGLRIGDVIVPPQTPQGVQPNHESTRNWFKNLLQKRPCEFFVLRKFGGDEGIRKFLATIFPRKDLPFSMTYSIHRFVLCHFHDTIGIEVREVTSKQFNLSFVTKVAPNSVADKLGLLKQDIICRPTKSGRLLSNVHQWFKTKLSSRERPFLFEIVRLHKVAAGHYAALHTSLEQNENCSSGQSSEKATRGRELRELIDLSDEQQQNSEYYREQSTKITNTLCHDASAASAPNPGRQKWSEEYITLQPSVTNTPTPVHDPHQHLKEASVEQTAVNETPIQSNSYKKNENSGAASSSRNQPSSTGAPTPLLVGTLSYDDKDGIRCHKICGTWKFEGSPESESQNFELTRIIPSNEDLNELPKNGTFNGSFIYRYQVDVKTSNKKLKMTTVIEEENVNIIFTKAGTDSTSFYIEGNGSNQFGTFELTGTAEKKLQNDDPSLSIRMQKKYIKANNEVQTQSRISISPNLTATSKSSQNELPPPSTHFSSGVICLRGKISWQSSGMRKIQLIKGVWSTGLNNILMDPNNVNGICHEFEYQQRSGFEYDGSTPLSGRHTGWFRMKSENDKLTDIHENYIYLNFEKNRDGFYNVHGKGGNEFGQYTISGTLSADNEIILFRHYCQEDKDDTKSVDQ